MKLQRQYLVFGVQPFNGNSVNVARPNRKKPEVADITGCTFFDVPLFRRRRVSTLVLLADLENVG